MSAANWYHASLKPIARSAGRSAVACAAYRTGAKLEDVRYGMVRDFTRKSDVVASFTLAPDGAPDWACDTAQLWNAVEAKENRKNSQLAFEWEVALPHEVAAGQREAIARELAQWLVAEYGVAVTVGIHDGGERGTGDNQGKNDHAHVMMTTRAVTPDGWARNKLRQFSTQPGKPNAEVDRVREQIARFINDALEDAGSDDRVDHRSYAARGIDLEPTTHLGPAASAMERRHGERTGRGDVNREIIEERLAWQLEQVQPELTAEMERDLAARFGDPAPTETEPRQADLPEGYGTSTGGPPEGYEASATGAPEGYGAAEPATPAATGEAHTGWRRFVDRVRAFQAAFLAYLSDESSGGRGLEPDVDGEPLSWTERIRGTARDVSAVAGWRRDPKAALSAGRRLLRGALRRTGHHAADPAHDAPHTDPERDPRSGRLWAEIEAQREAERHASERQTPDRPGHRAETRNDSAGPPTAFDIMLAAMRGGELEDDGGETGQGHGAGVEAARSPQSPGRDGLDME